MNFSFIVPLYNEQKTIKACLDAIQAEMSENDEIIVVDNGSRDDSAEIVRRYSAVRLLMRPGINVGAVRNEGATLAKNELLAFIDADCVLCPGWRKHIASVFGALSVGATGSKCDVSKNAGWMETAWFSQRKKAPGITNYINSGNLVVKKEAFFAAGGFDKSLISGEDAALCWRLRELGFTIFENPQARAIHLGNPKNLCAFYRQQKWHGMGMLATFKISWVDKPLIMTNAFLVCILLAFACLFLPGRTWSLRIAVAVLLLFGVPVLTAVYRVMTCRNFRYFPQLVILYFVYYTARLHALFSIFSPRLGR